MRKVGKYEKMRKNALLSSYITSVLCLVLCVTMFFGTTAAWFTDTTTSQGNQIYVGTLAVDLGFAAVTKESNGQETTYTAVAETVPIFDDSIRWEPGYTAIRKFELTEKGDLAFGYQLGVECEFTSNDLGTIDEKKAIAQAIYVWNYVGSNAEGPIAMESSFNDTVVLDTDANGKPDWELVGTLHDVITKKLPVFEGKMDKDIVTAIKKNADGTAILENGKEVEDPAKAYHLIALNMDTSFADASVQGKTLDALNIKLVATQLPSEQDAFGSEYDNLVYVETEEQLQAALNNAADGVKIVFANDIEGDVVATQKENIKITIDGNGKTLAGSITVNGQSKRYETAALTIKNVNFKANSISTEACVNLGKNGDSNTRYTNHVTISGCTFDVPGAVGVKSYAGGDWNVMIEKCVAKESAHSLAQLKNVEKGLKVIDCKAYSKNGLGVNNSPSLEMSGCDFNVRGYAVRFGSDVNSTDETFFIRNSTLSSGCEASDDAVIVFRAGASNAKLTLSNTMLVGTRTYLGQENATIIIETN